MVSGTRIGVPLHVDDVDRSGHVCMFLLSIIAGIKPLVAMERGVADFATHLAWSLVAMTTTAASFTATAASTTAMKCSIDTNLLLLLLRFNPGLSDQELRVQIIQHLWLSFGRECFKEWIKIMSRPTRM
jgi:hypothetical protein